jgi:hypothetical protein
MAFHGSQENLLEFCKVNGHGSLLLGYSSFSSAKCTGQKSQKIAKKNQEPALWPPANWECSQARAKVQSR